jgi:hypothetical protein
LTKRELVLIAALSGNLIFFQRNALYREILPISTIKALLQGSYSLKSFPGLTTLLDSIVSNALEPERRGYPCD